MFANYLHMHIVLIDVESLAKLILSRAVSRTVPEPKIKCSERVEVSRAIRVKTSTGLLTIITLASGATRSNSLHERTKNGGIRL